jgi:D-glycerate 3-kinase
MQEAATFTGEEAARLVAGRAADRARALGRQVLVGLNGAQGSGKSTMAATIADALAHEHGLSCTILSLDDFYLGRAERAELAARVHPLCATRGVPGTHDLALLREVLAALAAAAPDTRTPLPRFDKLADDRLPADAWTTVQGRPDCVLLEGWCVGIRDADLPPWTGPINALEAEHDADGAWHAWSRASVAEYEPLWDALDLLVSIEVPDLATVIDSRLRQEQGLAEASGRPAMDRAAITRFVEHYERYTRALWAAMPHRADLLLRRDRAYRFTLAG